MRFTREFQQDIEKYITDKPDSVIGKLKTYTLEDIVGYIFGYYPDKEERKRWRKSEDYSKLAIRNYLVYWPPVSQVNNKFILQNFWKKHEFRCEHPSIKPFSYAVGLKTIKEGGTQKFTHWIKYNNTDTCIQSKFFPYQRWFEETYPILKEAFEETLERDVPPEVINKILDNLDWKKRLLKETRIEKKNIRDLYRSGDIEWLCDATFYIRVIKYCDELLQREEEDKDKAEKIIWLTHRSFLSEYNCPRYYYTQRIYSAIDSASIKKGITNSYSDSIWIWFHRQITEETYERSSFQWQPRPSLA